MKNISARNPLSIIALFISLIYGVSALLLGASVDKLAPVNQERLVWFIIFFPIAILSAFVYLVTFHHRKLYSPSDFRTDESFLTSGNLKEIGQKYLDESQIDYDGDQPSEEQGVTAVEEDAEDRSLHLNDEDDGASPADATEPEKNFSSRASYTSRPANFASFSYMIEGLVMQELQNEYKSPIRRDAAFPMPNGRTARVDGIIDGPSGLLIAEIKIIRSNRGFVRAITEGRNQLIELTAVARENMSPKVSGILVLVLDGSFDLKTFHRIEQEAEEKSDDYISVRILSAQNLINKYGLDERLV